MITKNSTQEETCGTKIARILKAKNDIKEALTIAGAQIDEDTKFEDYSNKFNFLTPIILSDYYNLSGLSGNEKPFQIVNQIKTLPPIDVSSVQSFESAFKGYTSLESIPELNTSKGIYFQHMFDKCSKLTTVSELDVSNGINFDHMFSECSNLTTLGIDKVTDKDGNPIDPWIFNEDISFEDCPLDHDSIVHVFNHLGTPGHTITISKTTYGYLSDEEKGIPTKKGWTLAS